VTTSSWARPARLWKGDADRVVALRHPTMRALVEACAGRDDPYLVCYSGGRKLATWSFRDFAAATRGMALWLHDLHRVRPGDRVMVATGNTDLTCVAYAALWSLGAISVLVNPAELDDFALSIAEDCAPSLLLTAAIPGGSGDALPCARMRLEPAMLEAWMRAGAVADWPEGPAPTPETPALIVYTSGTTGRSKGVVLDHGNLLINAEATRQAHAMDADHVHMGVLPLFHVNAMNFSFLSTLYAGSRLVLNRQFYLPEFWSIIAAEGAAVASLVPLLIQQLIDDPRALDRNAVPTCLRYVTSAAAPLSSLQLGRFRDRYGLRVQQSYGLSETVNFSLITPPDLDEATYRAVMLTEDRPASGAPVFGNDVDVVDDTGNLLGARAQGEIVVQGWNVMQGYWNAEPANAYAFRSGRFHTGDLGWWQEIGGRRFVYVTGRLKETIKRRGESVSLLEIDEVLQAAGEMGVAAVGFENRYAGEEIGLFVEGAEDPERAERLLTLCAGAMPASRRPRVVAFGPEISRTSTGKIQRGRMAAAFEAFAETDFDREARLSRT